jgi:hypothetical protein
MTAATMRMRPWQRGTRVRRGEGRGRSRSAHEPIRSGPLRRAGGLFGVSVFDLGTTVDL